MQTFLPFADFARSAQSLDNKRLGKQRVENLQILQTLLGKRVVNTKVQEPTGRNGAMRWHDLPESEWRIEEFDPKGWVNHPAVRMWRGHEEALGVYQLCTVLQWNVIRGFKDTCWDKTNFLLMSQELWSNLSSTMPSWLGDADFHRSHQSNLVRKLPEHYGPQFPGVPDDLEYVWPVP